MIPCAPTIVTETFLPLAVARDDRPDETYLVASCMDPWHAWPSLIGDKSYFDLAQSGDAQDWAIDPVNVLDGSSTSLRDLLIDKAQVHDCTILGVEGPLQYQRQSLVEGVLFGSGRPIILTPMKVLPPTQERILFAWDASPSAVKRQKHIDLS